MTTRIDLLNKKFSRLLVIKFHSVNKHKVAVWECLCDCGKICIVSSASLRNGLTRSCGCLASELTIKRNKLNTKHGFKTEQSGLKSNFYQIWSGFTQRCYNPNVKAYKNYGGRGIKVSPRWRFFQYFRDDMWKSYLEHIEEFGAKDTSLGRLDNNGDYKKSNCKWETWVEQANNRRTIKQILDNICDSCHTRLIELQLVRR